ncbi:hypothetical protein [Henriciella pelagia]|uniref:hypothetical protein n=1 Tax=Henriciella pelagia TaxID=1977912 RepID=UPI00351350F0
MTKKNNIGLFAVKSKTVRNILRGILATDQPSVSRQAMRRLKKEATSSDLFRAFQFLISSPTAQHVSIAPIFPASIEDCTSAPYLGDNRLEADLAIQKARFGASEQELLRAIFSVAQINDAVFERNGGRVSQLLQEHADDFGISLFLMRKALSLRHTEFSKEAGLQLGAAIDPFLSKRRHLLAVAFEDSVDEQLSYIRVRRTFLSHVKDARVSRAVSPVLQDFMSPFSWTSEQGLAPLEAYSRWGVLDSLEFLERCLSDHSSRFKEDVAEKIHGVIPESVHKAWISTFGEDRFRDVIDLLQGDPDFLEYRLFRQSLALSEFHDVMEYRRRIEMGFGHRLDGVFKEGGTEQTLVDSGISKVEHLLPSRALSSLPELPVDTRTCGTFHRTLALAGALSTSGSTLEIAGGKDLLRLLDRTMDVSLLLSLSELTKFIPMRSGDRLYEYLRTALRFDADENRVSDHAYRRATQDIVGQDFGGDIVKFAQYLDDDAPNVAEHLFATCNEYFLTELYLLFEDSNAVINAQADLLEWYGDSRKDEDAALRAKSHRLNLRLRKVRGSIDDTRIYVDQLKFQYWAMETIASSLRELASISDAISDSSEAIPNLDDPIAAVEDPSAKLFQVLNLAYKEFCTNEFYGVDSYIGRRIRHGTLHGVLVAELKEPVDAIADQFALSSPEFSGFVRLWHTKVEAVVKAFGLELLRVKSSERKAGLIIPSIGDSDKRSTALSMLNSVASALAEDRGASVAISYIYDFCWLLLEIDLKRLRAAALAAQHELVIRPNQHISGSGSELEAQILDAARHLNTELQQRFEQLVGWLTRPSNVSPSATLSLLFHAVIHEVQGRYSGFFPKCVELGETGIDMFGHRFHTFYDVLFVLVDNAAKHGERTGEIHFDVQSKSVSPSISEITMSVTSALKSGREESSYHAINSAMTSDIGAAMLEDKNSGLRKIRVLVEEVDELSDFIVKFSEDRVTFSVVMSLPITGTDQRTDGAE